MKQLILVIGVHRSGTSLLTKALETMGVSLGNNFIPTTTYNEKGFWEDSDFHQLNLEMLSAFNDRIRCTLSITKKEADWLCKNGFFEQATQLLLTKLPLAQPLGIKDPRFSVLLPFWKRVFTACSVTTSFVIALRHPLSVAASQERFETQRREQSLWTWISYLLSCLEESKGHRRIIVDYDALLKNPSGHVIKMARTFQLNINPALLDSYEHHFLDVSLRHFDKHQSQGVQHHFWQRFAGEMYETLFSVAQGERSFEEINTLFEEWKKKFGMMRPLLELEEKSSFLMESLKLQRCDQTIESV